MFSFSEWQTAFIDALQAALIWGAVLGIVSATIRSAVR
jgi:hypothetical protein